MASAAVTTGSLPVSTLAAAIRCRMQGAEHLGGLQLEGRHTENAAPSFAAPAAVAADAVAEPVGVDAVSAAVDACVVAGVAVHQEVQSHLSH